ncbi:SUKH-4 family immunity protein [Streptomyces cylindrosporus]|uniref:SUKH-4 family immunity protein n=1 Tax=Streptomyces cylindrosporus TaxID=2927583 RepID=A0ABS9YGM5_9ACTN|nr:SUKH-4 family immunity protein [Streptomyces cylindrosporus]MCI3276395.1 SUKH-4 family immunity protein [Streptomyces cylindrosporus]
MSTTDTAFAAIRFTEDQLDPYVTHVPTRHWLTGTGLPDAEGLLTFAALHTRGLRRLAECTDTGTDLADELRDRLVLGELLAPAGMAPESILLDGGTGEISTAYLFELLEDRPLAPSLEALVRFAAVTEELADVRGQFASFAGRYGPKAAAEASRRLLALFEEGTDGEVPAYWKAAALIRPLALATGPGTAGGLTLDVPARLLDEEFGLGRVVRFEDVDFPATLTHEPTRRFLRETGLPEDTVLFQVDTEVPLQTLSEYAADDRPGTASPFELPARADHLIRLGHLVEDNSLVVDGATGEVLNWSEPEAKLFPLNTDVSTLAFTLWLHHRERTIDEALSHELTTRAYDQLAATMLHVLASVDPTATTTDADWHYWTQAFQDEAGGVL